MPDTRADPIKTLFCTVSFCQSQKGKRYFLAQAKFVPKEIHMQTNIYGEKLIPCGTKPMTGFYRNGCCDTDDDDTGIHSVCVIVTKEFLFYSQSIGNDLNTPMPELNFPGLVPGDRWCLCASRWVEALKAGVAPLVVLEATHEKTLDLVPLDELVKFAYKGNLSEMK